MRLPTCTSCRFWQNTFVTHVPGNSYAKCKRYPPTILDERKIATHAETSGRDWCGEWRTRS